MFLPVRTHACKHGCIPIGKPLHMNTHAHIHKCTFCRMKIFVYCKQMYHKINILKLNCPVGVEKKKKGRSWGGLVSRFACPPKNALLKIDCARQMPFFSSFSSFFVIFDFYTDLAKIAENTPTKGECHAVWSSSSLPGILCLGIDAVDCLQTAFFSHSLSFYLKVYPFSVSTSFVLADSPRVI